MPTNKMSTTSTKTSSVNKKLVVKKGVKAPKPQPQNNKLPAQYMMGLNVSTTAADKNPDDKAPIKLLFSDRVKPVLATELVVVEGQVSEDPTKPEKNKFLFAQNPFLATHHKFKVGDKVEFIHILRNDNKIEYMYTLRNCLIERIELRIGRPKGFLEEAANGEQVLCSFEDKILDNEAKKLYNTVLGR